MAIPLDTPPSSQPIKFEEDLWDPSNLLQIAYDRLPTSELSCVGRIHHGIRCRWDIKEPQRSKIFAVLDSLARQSPEAVRDEQLVSLAASLLCRFHGKQADEVLRRWRDIVGQAARQHVSIGAGKVDVTANADSGGLDEILSRTASRIENLAAIMTMTQPNQHRPVGLEAMLESIEQALQMLENNVPNNEKPLENGRAASAREQRLSNGLKTEEKEEKGKAVPQSAATSQSTVSPPSTTSSEPIGTVESTREQELSLRCQLLETELAEMKQQQHIDQQNDSGSEDETKSNENGTDKVSDKIQDENARESERNDEDKLAEAREGDVRKAGGNGDCADTVNDEKPIQGPDKCRIEAEIIALPSLTDELKQQVQVLQSENKELKESIKACWLHRLCTFPRRRWNKSKTTRTMSEKGRYAI